MKTDLKNIDSLPEEMVLIRQNCGIKVFNNEGRWGEQKTGFHIQQPLAGFVKKEWWKAINIFQNLKLGKDNEILNKMVRVGEEITKEDLLKHTDLQKWLDLQIETKNFYNTIVEFNILVGINWDKEEDYRRTIVLLGTVEWELVNF
jgi:hypothetical protein